MAKVLHPVAVLVFVALCACGEPSAPSPSVGSNTNWLRRCLSDSECGDALHCQCGLCTRDCEGDEACGPMSDALCARRDEPAALTCEGEPVTSAGVCLPRCDAGSCGESQVCVDGACVPFSLPDNALCLPVATTVAEQRSRDDTLLALVQESSAQGVECGDARGPIREISWRVDPRLICVSRVLAADLAAGTAKSGTVDAEGRDTKQRMSMVGYTPQRWGVSFAAPARSPEQALRLMLKDAGNCERFKDPSFSDIGVANSGDAYVVTIGTAR